MAFFCYPVVAFFPPLQSPSQQHWYTDCREGLEHSSLSSRDGVFKVHFLSTHSYSPTELAELGRASLDSELEGLEPRAARQGVTTGTGMGYPSQLGLLPFLYPGFLIVSSYFCLG